VSTRPSPERVRAPAAANARFGCFVAPLQPRVSRGVSRMNEARAVRSLVDVYRRSRTALHIHSNHSLYGAVPVHMTKAVEHKVMWGGKVNSVVV
jgi:hypothetical protein